MNEPVRWVTKAEAAEELEISLSTLDRKIRKGEIEVVRKGRRVYVRIHGPEYLSDEELLRRAIIREDELERTVRELERDASELESSVSALERKRDEARDEVARWQEGYDELEEEHRRELTAHGKTRGLAVRLGLVAAALLVISVLVVAWLALT